MVVLFTPPKVREFSSWDWHSDIRIFLAGTIDNGNSRDWQKLITKQISDFNHRRTIFVFNPRRPDWNPNATEVELEAQIEWELNHLELANIIIFNFEPDSTSLITLLELGLHIKSKGKVLIVRCPREYMRSTNIKVTCRKYGIHVVETFEEAVSEVNSIIEDMIDPDL